MFSQVSVCPQGRGVHPLGRHPPGRHRPGRHPPWTDTFPPQTATAADGTHPTWMHCCFFFNYTGCSDPDPVPNAQRFPEHGPYERLSFVTYTCNTGYTLIGSASITCHSHGEWSSPSPTCTPTGKDFKMLYHPAVTSIISVKKRAYQ